MAILLPSSGCEMCITLNIIWVYFIDCVTYLLEVYTIGQLMGKLQTN